MARTLSDGLVTEKNTLAQTSPWIWLFEVRIDDSNALRICQYTTDVTWPTAGGYTYEHFPVKIAPVAASTEGEEHTTTVTIPNADMQLQTQIEDNNGLVDKVVYVRLVHSDHLADTDVPEWRFVITDCHVTREAISFSFGESDVYGLKIPNQHYQRATCRWRYGSRECGYDTSRPGALSNCSKTWDDCIKHGDNEDAAGVQRIHPARWGGFRSIPLPKQ